MSQASHNNQIDYIEFPAVDILKTKEFYSSVFGWKVEAYGPDYTSFADGRLAGGFTKAAPLSVKGILVVLYASDLEAIDKKAKAAGASITSWIRMATSGLCGERRILSPKEPKIRADRTRWSSLHARAQRIVICSEESICTMLSYSE